MFASAPPTRAAPSAAPLADLRRSAKLYGRTPAEWTVEWWQWALSIPAATHPGLDPSGEYGAVGQHGPVWFLVGAFNSAAVRRTVTVPEGRALFLPLINVQWDSIGATRQFSPAELRRFAAEYIETTVPGSVFLEIDGQRVTGADRGRVRAGPFDFSVPGDGLGQSLGQVAPRGVYAPAASDGYWAMVRPLAPGRHTIRFGGALGDPYDFAIDIEYTIDVVPTTSE